MVRLLHTTYDVCEDFKQAGISAENDNMAWLSRAGSIKERMNRKPARGGNRSKQVQGKPAR